MVYFFVKGRATVKCEIQPGQPHVLTVTDAEGHIEVAGYSSPQSLNLRWAKLCDRLTGEGWSGPFGRDPRD